MTKLHILNGPDFGQSYDLKEGMISIGRSPHNDVQLKDKTVSRSHLIIRKTRNRFFIKDLKSRNGTFFNGDYISPDVDVEVREGVPIVIGMSVICLGKGCLEYVMPVMDSIENTKEIRKPGGVYVQNRKNANQKILELISNVPEFLTASWDIEETSRKVLERVFKLLKRCDRGAVILCDPESGEVTKVISEAKKEGEETETAYCAEVVASVIRDRKAVCISDSRAGPENDLSIALKAMKIGSVLCVPLVGSSQILGVIYVDSLQEPHGFREKDLSLLMELSKKATLAIEHVLLYERLG